MATAYDEILYPSLPFERSHPSQMAAMAALFGRNPAPPEHCRVLEIACADGGNLIPMACEFPASSFVGFDLAPAVVANGQQQIAELGLSNIRIDQADLMDTGSKLGAFDYIIAHGVYSWIPDAVRNKLLSTMKELLAPEGIGYISYNALPGCRIRQMLREMMLIHLGGVTGAEERIQKAREFLQALVDSQRSAGDIGKFLQSEAQFLLDQGPVVLFHDELAEIYHPVYIHQFVEHAAQYGLQFLCEAGFAEMQTMRFPESVIERTTRWAGEDRVRRELYHDFLCGRTFRRTLLCHAGLTVANDILADRIAGLWAASPAHSVSKHPDWHEGKVEEFRGPHGSACKTAHPLAKAALQILTGAWPEAMSFPQLLDATAQLTDTDPDPESITQILRSTFAAGLVELHAVPPRCIRRVTEFPQTTPLVRWQAARGSKVTTPRHTTVDADGEVERRMLTLLDGARDIAALADEMAPLFECPRAGLMERVAENLKKLARFGLLIA